MVFQFRKNLILVVRAGTYDPADFVDIGNRIAARAPDIRVFVVDDAAAADLPAAVWGSPTLSVSIRRPQQFQARRGPLLCNRPIDKRQQTAMMQRLGVRTLHCAEFAPGMDLPHGQFGDMVILKPADLPHTSHGQAIQLLRRGRLAAMRLEDFAADHAVRKMPLLVQRFVDTGAKPAKYRALTLFGEILYCQKVELLQERPALDAPDREIERAVIDTNGGDRVYTSCGDSDVLEFARTTATAFGGLPLLGIDIIRDTADGTLYALEVNAGGNVWHFSSPYWADLRAKHPRAAREMQEQFGAFDVAARSLIQATRRMAA